MKKIIKNLAYLCVLTMTLLCSGCGEEQVTISGNSEENVTEKASQQGAEEAGADDSVTIHSETPEYITVFVCGAVKNEGVYELEAGSRANDGLEAAGGFSDDADTVAVNLADVLEDGQKLYTFLSEVNSFRMRAKPGQMRRNRDWSTSTVQMLRNL